MRPNPEGSRRARKDDRAAVRDRRRRDRVRARDERRADHHVQAFVTVARALLIACARAGVPEHRLGQVRARFLALDEAARDRVAAELLRGAPLPSELLPGVLDVPEPPPFTVDAPRQVERPPTGEPTRTPGGILLP